MQIKLPYPNNTEESTIHHNLRFKYTTKFSLPKIACPAIVYVEIVAVIDPYFVGVCLSIKVYRYNPTEICQQRLQGVRNVAQKLCSWERSLMDIVYVLETMSLNFPQKDRVVALPCFVSDYTIAIKFNYPMDPRKK